MGPLGVDQSARGSTDAATLMTVVDFSKTPIEPFDRHFAANRPSVPAPEQTEKRDEEEDSTDPSSSAVPSTPVIASSTLPTDRSAQDAEDADDRESVEPAAEAGDATNDTGAAPIPTDEIQSDSRSPVNVAIDEELPIELAEASEAQGEQTVKPLVESAGEATALDALDEVATCTLDPRLAVPHQTFKGKIPLEVSDRQGESQAPEGEAVSQGPAIDELVERAVRELKDEGPAKRDAKKSTMSHDPGPVMGEPQTQGPIDEVTAVAPIETGSILDDKPDRKAQEHAKVGNLANARSSGGSDAVSTTTPGRLAHHLVNHGEGRGDKGSAMTGPDQHRFVDRVVKAFQAAESRHGVVKLRLHPPELGVLRVELKMQHGGLTAKVEAESTAAHSLLLEHADALRDRLIEHGVKIERFDVELGERGTAMNPRQGDEHRSGQRHDSSRRGPDAQPTIEETPKTGRLLATPGQLNVMV